MQAGYPGKRLLDVVGAAVALVVCMPLQIVVAATIKVDTRGPVLFRQTRIGAGGRPFQMLKFQKFKVVADDPLTSNADSPGGGPLFDLRDFPRFTRVGRLLHASSFDALPQLVNVLRGDMSLVGPRATRPAGVAYYERVAPRVLLVKPGMTGLSQVTGPQRSLPWDDVVQLDSSYVDTARLRLDLVVLGRASVRSLRTLSRSIRSLVTRAPMVW